MQFEDTIDELYSCLPRDRNKFNIIMENMKKKFLRNIKTQRQAQNNQFNISFQPNKQFQNYVSNNTRLQNFNNLFQNNNNYNNKNNLNNKQNLFNSFHMNNNIRDSLPSIKFEQNYNYKPIKINEKMNDYNTQRNFYSENKKKNIFELKNIKNNGFKGTLPDALLIKPKPIRTKSLQKLLSDINANSNFYCPEKNNVASEEEIDIDGNGWHNQANNIMFNTNENFFIGNK